MKDMFVIHVYTRITWFTIQLYRVKLQFVILSFC